MIKTWLTTKSQCVINNIAIIIVNGEASSSVRNISGVLQGADLVPLMFSLYSSDIYENLNSTLRLQMLH